MKLKTLHQWLETTLESQTPSWKSEARLLLCHFLDMAPIDLLMEKEKVLADDLIDQIRQAASRRISGEPLQYILGVQYFMNLPFIVNRNVLIPRPETEVLVEWIASKVKAGDRVLDIGTGSGAIAVSLAFTNRTLSITATDISKDALDVALENAKENGVESQVRFLQGDLFEPVKHERFNIIVSNPPYIPEGDAGDLMVEVTGHEPHQALFAGEDGLDLYRRIIPQAMDFLEHEGVLVFEAGHDQSEAIMDMFREFGYEDIGVFEDLCEVPRFIYGKKA